MSRAHLQCSVRPPPPKLAEWTEAAPSGPLLQLQSAAGGGSPSQTPEVATEITDKGSGAKRPTGCKISSVCPRCLEGGARPLKYDGILGPTPSHRAGAL